MTKYLKFTAFACTVLLAYSACTRPSSSARTTSGHYINATITGGRSFSVTDPDIHVSGTVGGNVKIDGFDYRYSELEFGFVTYPATTGTYPLNGTSYLGSYNDTAETVPLLCVHGTLTLTAVSPDVIGTFTFTRSDSSVVTGSLNVPAP